MFGRELARIETEFYRGLNSLVEPLVRAGVGSPVFWPTGAIVIEVTGRNTGQKFNLPLLAARVGDLFVVSTYRRRSEWVRNLAANGEICYWLGGRRYDGTAFVITPDRASSPSDALPPRAACLAAVLKQQSQLFGISFAILMPRS